MIFQKIPKVCLSLSPMCRILCLRIKNSDFVYSINRCMGVCVCGCMYTSIQISSPNLGRQKVYSESWYTRL